MAALAETQVFFVDELSMLSASLFSCLDFVLRDLMHTDVPWGGKLIIATGDCQQLPPIDSSPIWISSHMITTFYLITLKNYVRSADDEDLREVIELLRKTDPSESDADTLCDIITLRCHFVSCWSRVPRTAMRVVATRQAEKDVTKSYLADLAQDNITVEEFECHDETESAGAQWNKAHEFESRKLDRLLLEERCLKIFTGALVRMTYNNNLGDVFSQGQCAIIRELPDPNTSENDQVLTLTLVPPGEDDFQSANQENWLRVRHFITSLYVALIKALCMLLT